MSTRATVRIAEREAGVSFNEHTEDYHAQIYNHWDGYPEGLGVRLAEFIRDMCVVNGISGGEGPIQANGLGDLSAMILCELKTGIEDGCRKIQQGGVYLDKYGTERSDLEYEYYVWATEGKDIWISIFDTYRGECIFVGKPDKLIEKYEYNDR